MEGLAVKFERALEVNNRQSLLLQESFKYGQLKHVCEQELRALCLKVQLVTNLLELKLAQEPVASSWFAD